MGVRTGRTSHVYGPDASAGSSVQDALGLDDGGEMQSAVEGDKVHVVCKVEDLFGHFVVGSPVGAVAVRVILSAVLHAIVHYGRGQRVRLVADEALTVEAGVGDEVLESIRLLVVVVVVFDVLVLLMVLVLVPMLILLMGVGVRHRLAVGDGGRVRLFVVVDLDGAVVSRGLQANRVGVLGGWRGSHGAVGSRRVKTEALVGREVTLLACG